jgi:hypothetical protein
MRPADIHRVEKAIAHLDAANTVLDSIKWENVSALAYEQIKGCKEKMQGAKWHLQDALKV